MLRIKSINFTPQVLICYALLLICICLSAFKSYDKAAVPVMHSQFDTTQVLPYTNAYTILIVNDYNNKQTGKDLLLMDGRRVVSVIHMDSTCHMMQAIEMNNQ